MKAQDVMTQYVISVGPNDTVERAIRAMLQNDISGLPVIDKNGELVGMITEGDLLRRIEIGTERQRTRLLEFFVGPGTLANEYVQSHGRKVSEVMTAYPVSVGEETPLQDVVALMEKQRIKRVPVVRAGKVVGIVSRANLLHALARIAGEAKPTSTADQTIRQNLMAELGKGRWAPIAALDITVRNGVVDLWGAVTDERQRQAIVVAAENIPGVKSVKDHIAWIDPTGMAIMPEEPAETARAN